MHFFCKTTKTIKLGHEALQQQQIKQLKQRNKIMHKKLKETKSDKMMKLLDLVQYNLQQSVNKNDNNNNNNNNSNDNIKKDDEALNDEQDMDDDLQLALNDLGVESDEVEILPPQIEEKKDSLDASNQTITMMNTRSASSQPAVMTNFDYRRKIHLFIADVTVNTNLEDEDKQQLVASFYDPTVSDETSSYLDSLLATRKSSTEIAKNLLWFINCLKKREDKV